MAIRKIVIEGDAVLAKKCRPVEKFDDRLAELLDDLYDTLVDADGCGIAAPQVGIIRRACIVDVGNGKVEMVNPEIIEAEGEQHLQEGCLSCPNQWGVTTRPAKIKVRAQDRKGDFFEFEATELFAVACCHEIDHLDGILFKEHVIGKLTADAMDEEEIEELLSR
ncbi:MAG: peptide deformylase [Oscillospiraceae bacterium]|nr:peptide deformylase [Oscillospiraceae bacterium]